ncbi:MAG: hypothetical protein UW73_C0001G0068 [Microgenomates group bacterium GW2011_GWB1_44_8]|nr:MAG: hypothetical protein UW73_C0001G0068 [Microgenomates group bacterium GW2011_GWB1_44_8]
MAIMIMVRYPISPNLFLARQNVDRPMTTGATI